jgi:hypothetical protein
MTVTCARRITEAMMKEIVKDQEVIPEKRDQSFSLKIHIDIYIFKQIIISSQKRNTVSRDIEWNVRFQIEQCN